MMFADRARNWDNCVLCTPRTGLVCMLMPTCKSCRSIDYTEPFKPIDPLKLSWYCYENYSQVAFVRLFEVCRAKHTPGDYDLLALQIVQL